MSYKHACVTGLGTISPLGPDTESSWKELIAGTIALATTTDGLAQVLQEYPVGQAYRDVALDRAGVDTKLRRRMDPMTTQAIAAAHEAVADAGLQKPLNQSRAAVVLGVGFGAAKSHYYIASMCVKDQADRMTPFAIPAGMPNSAACNVSLAMGSRGPTWTTATACAAGLDASGIALMLIQNNLADVVITGGTEAIVDDIGVGGMSAARALSKVDNGDPAVLRPFDKRRRGTAVGEGAAILVLETPEHAAQRGARIRAEICGYGSGSDAFHITQPRPDGSGALDVMRASLAAAEMQPSDLDVIFAHGTGTPLNDAMEGKAVCELFGSHLPMVTSTKGQYGHAMGTSGPFHLVFAVKAMEDGVVPATVTCTDPDPECGITPVLENTSASIKTAMVNAFGFGGHNASVILRRPS